MPKNLKLNESHCKIKLFEHQRSGIQKLLDNPAFFLADEMGAGKSAQVISAACALAEAGEIDTVVCVCPASVRCVWTDPEIGEIKKFAWKDSSVYEFHSHLKQVWGEAQRGGGLLWFVTNYEFLRGEKHLNYLIEIIKEQKTLLVLDESSYIKSRTAQQTKAIAKLRALCDRCVLLNGTPVVNSPLDLWSQLNVLDKKILGRKYTNFYSFRAAYCEMQTHHYHGGRFQQVTGYKNLDNLSKLVAPYVLRRLKADCLDLPEKLYTQREVALTPESWKRYKELKRDALITLGDEGSSNQYMQLEPNAAVRVMRLAQLTSGILGSQVSMMRPTEGGGAYEPTQMNVQDLSSEKLDWCVKYLTEECTAKAVIVFCRWRRERERLVRALSGKIKVQEIYGGQSKKDREAAVNSFSVVSDGPRSVLVAQQHCASHGLNLIAATEEWFLSNDFSWGIRAQAEDRIHRGGQNFSVLIGDVLATGPAGQKTIDHHIMTALREKENLASFTTSRWRKILEEE